MEETPFRFEQTTPGDYKRIAQLLEHYADANIDCVDAVIVAMAERFGTLYIMTVDERDFRRYKPAFADHFVLPVFDV